MTLVGIPKMEILGENLDIVEEKIDSMVLNTNKQGIVFLEDMVGTGNQAKKVLEIVSKKIPDNWKCLFVPLITLHSGYNRLIKASLKNFDIDPVLKIDDNKCIKSKFKNGEPVEFNCLRGLIIKTKSKVCEKFHEFDDSPKDAFGYESSGAFVVTSHNTPNNTIPIIHHRAPDWFPIFRRVHHLKDE